MNATTQHELPKVIATRLIPHRADVRGDRIGKVETVQVGNATVDVAYWYDANNRLVAVR